MKAIIMAGGADENWANHLGVRRQLAPFDGEPLLHRTIRQLRQRSVADIVIVGPPELETEGTRRIEPTHLEFGYEALNAIGEWSPTGRTLQVYGDTYFTDRAMDTIVRFKPRRWQLFGRHGGSALKRYGEIFAIGFWPEHRARWERALREGFRLKALGVIDRAGSWEGYRILGGARGTRVQKHRLYPALFTEINDGTDDFDTPAEYDQLRMLTT